jgi:hypothetical protein
MAPLDQSAEAIQASYEVMSFEICAASARLARQRRFPADFRAGRRDGVQFDGMTRRRNCGAVPGAYTTR